MPRPLIHAVLLILWATPAAGGEPDPSDPSMLEDIESRRARLQQLLERGQESRGAERRALFTEALPLAEALALAEPGSGSRRRLCLAQLGAREVAAVATCEAVVREADETDAGQTRYLLGQAYATAARWENAEATLHEALKHLDEGETHRRIHRVLGFIYEKTKRFDEAVAAYVKGNDPASVVRIKSNLEAPPWSDGDPERMREEAERLEEELRALERENGGGG